MNIESAATLIECADRVTHDFIGQYDPHIRTLHFDPYASENDNNVVAFHRREMITIAALMNCGVDPRVASALVGDRIIPLAEPVSEMGDFETEDGSHWRLAIQLPTSFYIDPSPYFVWAVDEDGNPHDLCTMDPSRSAIVANRLPADFSAKIEAARVKPLDAQTLKNRSPAECARAMRTYLTAVSAADHVRKPEFSIRAALVSSQEGIRVFDYKENLAVAALVRIGYPASLAAAIVDQDYAFAAPVNNGSGRFPESRPYDHPGANWEPVDIIKLDDGSQWAIMMADLGPIFDPEEYDVWSFKGKHRIPVDAAAMVQNPITDPTRKAIRGKIEYRAMAAGLKAIMA